ncbi:MAG: glycoside hydrolase family 127 protein [Bacteroidales bacterium]|nr:glycoside hydrolase family 127 protein [Bacteroidales bacterium]
MRRAVRFTIPAIIILTILSTCRQPAVRDYPISAVEIADVDLTDQFWAEIIDRNLKVTLPYVLKEMNSRNSTGLSGLSKVIEGISYHLLTTRDPDLESLADSLISTIVASQQPDGYIGRPRTASDGAPVPDSLFWLGTDDFGETGGSPMLYGFGHLYEAAVAYYGATGKTSLLDIAEKNARLLLTVFGTDKLIAYPFHPEIELALVKLYRSTGKKEYLELSHFFLDSRGPGGTEYSQSHKKIVDQREATGHAVRALYLYAGVADIVALTGDKRYRSALDSIWASVVESKLYITGGLGSYADHEAFGAPYYLPNETAYNETCASIASILWNQRMFMLNGNSDFIDVLERTLYNSLLSGISVTGDRFFYPNPLASSGQYQRASWYGVSCCPTNIIRFLPQVPGLIYACSGNDMYINLFISNSSDIKLKNGNVAVTQVTDYPWQGNVKVVVNPETSFDFTIRVRIPGWANSQPVPSDLYNFMDDSADEIIITLNGEVLNYRTDNGYAVIKRTWSAGDVIKMELPMKGRKIAANNRVEDDRGRFAIQRGPIVYCLEGPDNFDGMVKNVMVPADAGFRLKEINDMQKGAIALATSGYSYRVRQGSDSVISAEQEITAIPYYLWANRGRAEMVVWIPYDEQAIAPCTENDQTIASRSRVLASYDTTTLSGINDQFIIPYNQNIPISSYYRWPLDDTIQWVQYQFENTETVSSVDVYWYDNEPSRMTTWYNGIPWTCCRVPQSWELLYLDADRKWKPVKALNDYGVGKYMYNRVNFEPVKTTSLKMIVKRDGTCASGLIEWIVGSPPINNTVTT